MLPGIDDTFALCEPIACEETLCSKVEAALSNLLPMKR